MIIDQKVRLALSYSLSHHTYVLRTRTNLENDTKKLAPNDNTHSNMRAEGHLQYDESLCK